MFSFRCFVDDAGKNPTGPALVLGSWTARVDDWERFSDAWDIALNTGKPLKTYRGHKYFTLHDALNQTGCFQGFTPREAALKTVNLAWVLTSLSRRVAGLTAVVAHCEYKALVTSRAIKRRYEARREQRDPFYIAFSELVPRLVSLHYHAGWRGKENRIDFIVDGNKSDKALRDCVRAINNARENFKDESWYHLMGEIIPGDDRELAPLQAADMLAGLMSSSIKQLRVDRIVTFWERHGVPIRSIHIGQDKLEGWSARFNQDIATDILTAIKQQQETKQ